MKRKTLIAAAICTVISAPFAAFGDEDATRWPAKAEPTAGQDAKYKARRTTRADEAMSGTDTAASRGSTRPNYDPPMRPNDARPIPPFREDPSAASGGTAAKRDGR
jgi:hypothetical protein